MSIDVPDLDTIAFEDLVAEARDRIPRYAPEWTDHNLHDPGITLLELIAWGTDQQIYQLGFVGERYRAAFAKLLGVVPRAARPARGLLWPNAVVAEADVALASPVIAERNEEFPFLVDLACRLSAAQPIALEGEGRRGRVHLLETGARPRASFPAYDAAGGGIDVIELRVDRPILQRGTAGSASGIVPLGIEIERPALAADADASQVPLWARLRAQYRLEGSAWMPLQIVRDDTHGLLRSGVIAVEVPAVETERPSALRMRLGGGFFPAPPRISRLALNALPVVQLEHRPGAILAPGTGLPDQEHDLTLSGRPAPSDVAPSLRIEVADPEGWSHWPAVDALDRLGPDARRVMLDEATNTIRFGNGINGRVPALGASIRHSAYALSLGASGNVRAGLTWQLKNQATGLWQNTRAMSGGEDAWTIARTELEARRAIRHPSLALGDAELRSRLRDLPGFAISGAHIVPFGHPAMAELKLPGHRTIVVVPEIMRSEDLTEADAAQYLGALRARLAPDRLAGERVHVTLPQTVEVRARVELLIDGDASAEAVRTRARALLTGILAPLPSRDGAAWPLGRAIDAGRLSGLLAGLAHVIAVPRLDLARNGAAFATDDIPLGPFEVPRSGRHEITLVRTPGGVDGP